MNVSFNIQKFNLFSVSYLKQICNKLCLTFNFKLILIKKKNYYIYLIIIQTVYKYFCHSSNACVNDCNYILPMLSVKKISKVLFSKCICLFTICCFICFRHTVKWWYGFSKTPWLIPVLTHYQTVHSEYIESHLTSIKNRQLLIW